MAQPRDGNISNRNSDGGSIDAEQILNSIIDHVEGSDGNVQPEVSTTEEAEVAPQVPAPAKARSGPGKGHSKADFERIEKRAAELAAMLGGAGLSYSEAAKKHLDDFADTGQEEIVENPPLAVATIHRDDVSMESRSFDFHLDDFPKINAPENVDLNDSVTDDLQKQHVSEWQADADDDYPGTAATDTDTDIIEQQPDMEPADPARETLTKATPMSVAEEKVDPQMVSIEPSRELIDVENELLEQAENLVEEPRLQSEFLDELDGADVSGTIMNIAQNIDLTKEQPEATVPDLLDIEEQMEVMSVTFKEADAPRTYEVPASISGQQEIEPVAVVAEQKTTLLPDMNELDIVDTRVAELEAQIVDLLGKNAQDDEALEEKVAGLVRQETQTAVAEAINSSPLFLSLANELEAIGKERQMQETRMSDSLDALHDALKDLGERVSFVETTAKAGNVTTSEELLIPGAGIASSLLDGSHTAPELHETVPSSNDIVESENVPEPELEPQPQAEPVLAVQDELPTWLEDATEELLQEEKTVADQKADVFASRGVPVLEQAQVEELLIATEDVNQLREPESARSGLLSEDMFEMSRQDRLAGQPEAQADRAEPQGQVTQQAEPNVELNESEEPSPVPSAEPVEAETLVVATAQAPEPKDNDFLTTARAAARQANDRVKQKNGSENGKKENGGRVFKAVLAENVDTKEAQKISFIEQAKQKQLEAGGGPASLKPAGNRSLFSEKIEGPNSLLVFTSLILFGTSALLLYGMSRNSQGAGTTTKVNAVEQQIGKTPALDHTGKLNGHKVNGAAGKASHLPKEKKNKGPKSQEQKRSDAGGQSSKLVGSLQKTASSGRTEKVASSTDTLTDYDKMVSSGIATIPPVYTGTTIQPLSKDKAGSLFKEDIGFSRAATVVKTASSQKKKPEEKASLLALASRGDAQAQYQVAHNYGKGEGLKKNPALSVEWFEKSAKAGYAPAIYRLATMYERGTGVSKNYKRAMELYKTAAGKGNIKAMHNLAVLYMGGHLGKGDFKNAVKWYKKAAEYGVRDSQFNLAIIFHNGLANKVDLVRAYKWYKLAARAGDEEARDIASDLLQELSDAQKKRVGVLLGNWKKKIPNKNANAPRHFGKA